MLGPPSITRSILDKDEDWVRYYVNMYVATSSFSSLILTFGVQVRQS